MSIEKYEVIVGCEVHVQLFTNTKAFCSCENRFGGIPNTRVCPVCLGLPGALPHVNRELVEKAIVAGLALHCQIAEVTKFDRKNYMYPDLSKGYQISQFDMPICTAGYLDVKDPDGKTRKVRIIRLHMEEDAGKNLHLETGHSYVDFNRCGTPLIEIVSEPDMRSPDEAVAYVQGLREIFRFLGVSDCNMEEGSLRCDANINLWVWEDGKKYATPIAEIKNMNSFKAMKTALSYEVERQKENWEKNHVTLQMAGKETRGYDEKTGHTLLQRTKEEASDYRYFPEPDLKPVVVPRSLVEKLKEQVVELPAEKRARFMKQYGLTEFDVTVLTDSKALCDWYEELAKGYKDPKKAANWLIVEILAVLNVKGQTIEQFNLTPAAIRELLEKIDSGEISGKIAKDVFADMVSTGKSAATVIAEKGIKQISDSGTIAAMVDAVIAENPKAVEDYRKGKDNAVKFLMGQVMRKSKGAVNPQTANDLVTERLKAFVAAGK